MGVAKNVVLPVHDLAEAQFALPLARAIAGGSGGEVILVGITGNYKYRSANAGGTRDGQLERMLVEFAASDKLERGLVPVRVRCALWPEVLEMVGRGSGDLLLLPWFSGGSTLDADLVDVLTQPPCDVALLRPGTAPPFRRVLLPLRGGPHATLALETSVALARVRGAQITALHSTPYAPRAQSDMPFHDLRSVIRVLPLVTQVSSLRDPVHANILRQVPGHDLLVMAATNQPLGSAESMDEVTRIVLRETHCTVLAVKSRHRTVLPFPGSVFTFRKSVRST